MNSELDIMRAKMAGVKAALEGRKLDANEYPEDSDLHFVWLAAWADTRMEMMKSPKGQRPC